MEIIQNLDHGVCNIALVGLFTFDDHAEFRTVLAKMDESDISQFVFNLEKLDFVDSAALGMFLLAHDTAGKNQKRLALTGATGQVKKMFDLARFNTIFTMY